MRRLRPRPLPIVLLMLVAVAASLVAAPGASGIFGATLAALTIAIAVSDARRFIIPDELIIAALALAFIQAGFLTPDAGLLNLSESVVRATAIALGFLLVMIGYRWVRGRDGIGLGDVKLAAVAGAWLDWLTVLGMIEGAALAGIAFYFIVGLQRRSKPNSTHFIPFGTFLAPAIWIGWLFERLIY